MKLQDTNTTIAQIGTSQESQFKMKTSRKAFQILSDLYSDKPLAIVRELGCNASDSMVAAGKADKPFHIHLPNALEPWITIQDYGTGISHENIYAIYSTYFESTKTNTNDQIGCLGLGSKSPFCYSDNFVVTSIHEGVKSIYNAYFNEQNTPAIALMSRQETSEENGIAIQIPVKADDFTNFKQAVEKAFRFFPIKPTISGGKVDWLDEKPLFTGKGWEAYNKFGYGECYAIMGGVTYPVSIFKLDHKHQNLARKGGLVLYFDMGELDFTPSRESLSYCDQTIKALNEKLAFVESDIKVKLSQMLSDKTNIMEAIRSVYVLRERFEHLTSSINFDNLKWRGIDIGNPYKIIQDLAKEGVTTYKYATWGRSKYQESMQPSFAVNSVWYYDDLPKGLVPRVRSYLKNVDNKAVMTIFTMEAFTKLTSNNNPDLVFDKSAFIPTSSLPLAVKAPSQGGTKVRGQKTSFNIYTIGDTWKESWVAREFDPANPVGKYYFLKGKTWQFSFKIPNMTGSFSSKACLHTLANFLGCNREEIIMVAPRFENDLASHGIKNIVDAVSEKIKFTDQDFDDLATLKVNDDTNFRLLAGAKGFNTLDKTDELVAYTLKLQAIRNKFKGYEHIINRLEIGDKKVKATLPNFTNPVHKILMRKIGTYSWEIESIITILQNLKK